MSTHACVNCFAPLTGGAVCGQCGFNNAVYRPQPHHLSPGAVLRNRYVVGRAMGQGGFGITYVGFDQNLDFKVAVKEYFPDGTALRDAAQTAAVTCYPSQSARERFSVGILKCMNEARALAKLGAIPSIVRVQDFFQENNTAYIIMEYVEGVTLNAYLKRQPERPCYREALALLSPVGEALEKIHARGFVHRDVSPDNIMIDQEGQPKLLDFGAVKAVATGGSVTENPVIKRGFSPMEMYTTDGKIGPWSDVYAFCATLFYLLTGKAPDEPMNRAEEDRVGAALEQLVSPSQREALLKGLAFYPKQRYQSIPEMTAALTACQNDPAPAPGTAPAGAAMPRTEAAGKTVPEKTEPAAMPETAAISRSISEKTEPAFTAPWSTMRSRPLPEKTEPVPTPSAPKQTVAVPKTAANTVPPTSAVTGRTAPAKGIPAPIAQQTAAHAENRKPSVPAYDLLPAQPARKKKPVVLAVVLTALVALGVGIGISIGRSSGKVSVSTSTASPVTQLPAATSAPAATQPPATQPPTTLAPTTEPPTTAAVDPVIESLLSANVGDYVTFGAYEQDNDTSNGKEAIEWLVLAKESDKALLISRYGLDCLPYNESKADVTWETCSLRVWLNGTFYNTAFSDEEKGWILMSTITVDSVQDLTDIFITLTETTDKIFLLSSMEAKIFGSNSERLCKATEYVESKHKWPTVNGNRTWWLRTHTDSERAACVINSGYISDIYVNDSGVVVRPALWIDLTS